MSLDSHLFWSFLIVFVRCSAMFLSSPILTGQSTPVNIRVMVSMAISASLTLVIQPKSGPVPSDMYNFAIGIGQEILVGLLIGVFITLAFSVFQMAGSLLDMQVGLSQSQIMNPVDGLPSSLLSQFKYMLAMTVFLAMGGHQILIRAFVESYEVIPTSHSLNFVAVGTHFTELMGTMCLLGIQIAAPVAAVGLVIDASLGVINKAVPQFPAAVVGTPAKVGMGLVALAFALPAMVGGVSSTVEFASNSLWNALRGG